MKIYKALLLVFILLTACSKNKTTEIERSTIAVDIVSRDLESAMPGQLIRTENFILWTDPFNAENVVHVLDPVNGDDIKQFVSVGGGPYEFSTPQLMSYPDNCLYVYDLNADKQIVFSLDSVVQNKPGILKATTQSLKNITSIIPLNEQQFIYFNPAQKQPFTFVSKGQNDAFGKLPFPEEVDDSYACFQGQVMYHPKRECLVYTTFMFPYVAVYQKKKNSFDLYKELLSTDECSVSQGKLSYNKKERGAGDLALTSDYIVTLERDRKVDQTDEQTVGRDFTKLPHTVFLYDYDLNLVKILDLGMPILRLAASPQNNQLYAIGLNPDFVLITCEL
ncbi:hypothetical protein [Parabacteroides chinchillae]